MPEQANGKKPHNDPDEKPLPDQLATESDARLLKDARTLLQTLLSNPEGLFTGSTDTGSDLRQVLPSPKPMIQQVGGQWRWLYDFWGHEAPAVPSITSSAEMDGVLVSTQSASSDSDVALPPTAEQIAAIRDVNRALYEWSDAYIDLQKLASEVRLLDLSPTYVSFEDAAKRYLASNPPSSPDETTHPSLQADKTLIADYFALLQRSRKAVKQALFLAELLAHRQEKPREPRRISLCLLTLSDELEFPLFNAEQLSGVLSSYQSDLSALGAPNSPDAQPALEFAQIESDVTLLTRDWLFGMAGHIRERQWPPLPDQPALSNYLIDRFEALMRSIRTGERMWRVSWEGLRLRVDDRVPQFRGDPNNISLLQYAEVLLALSSPDTPPDLMLGFLCQLGFGREMEMTALKNTSLFGKDHLKLLLDVVPLRSYSGQKVVVVLRGTADEITIVDGEKYVRHLRPNSPIETFSPSRNFAVLPVVADVPANVLGPLTGFRSDLTLLDDVSPEKVGSVPVDFDRAILLRSGSDGPSATPNEAPASEAPVSLLRTLRITRDFASIDDVIIAALKALEPTSRSSKGPRAV